MVCLINGIAVIIFSLLGRVIAQSQVNVQDVDNAEQFALLCRIYNVAKNPPINHVDLQDPNKIVNEIDAINASFAEETQINETEHVENSSDAQVKPTTTREAAVAQAILRRITQKAHNILKEFKKTNITEGIEKAKAEFSQVIFGVGMDESDLFQGTLTGLKERAEACGKSGLSSKGGSAGKNLVVDFFCLCAMRTERSREGLENVCGVKVGGKDDKSEKHGWGNAAPSGSSSMWASVKKGCGKLMHEHPMSTEESHEVLGDFLKHLKSGGLYRLGTTLRRDNTVKGSNRKEGMLGTAVGEEGKNGTDLICDGSRGNGRGQPPGGICVYYGPDKWEENIEWVKHFQTAMNTVQHVNNQTATIQRDIEKLHMLLHRAEKIYETKNVITEIQKPAVPPNLQTAAKRLTAYNASWSHHPYAHSILTWILL